MATHMAMHIATDMRSERATVNFQVAPVYVDCTSAHQLKAGASGPQRINRRLDPYGPNELSEEQRRNARDKLRG